MSRYVVSILLAVFTCIGWGVLAPLSVQWEKVAGAKFHPLQPLVWGAFGNVVIVLIALAVTDFAPLRNWTWHWSGRLFGFFWALAGVTFVYALSLAAGHTAIPTVVAASYSVLVSAPMLWYFFGQALSLQKLVGIVGMFIFMLVAVFG